MSLRYTGEATMDEPALRDVERWKDKIEVRLDNRQVFFLFFGSAMVACMLFVLGVIVGKRLESRGRAEAPAIEDPLAVLDRFGVATPAPAPAALTFPSALLGVAASKPATGGLERAERSKGKQILTAAAPVSAGIGKVVSPSVVPKVSGAVASLALPRAGATPTPPIGSRTSAIAATSPATPTTAPALAPAPTSKRLSALPRVLPTVGADGKQSTTVTARDTVASLKSSVSAGGKSAIPATTDKPKSHFLLQLSSFQERAEADAFARRFAAQNAYVVATEIPGKGTWYRVRVGNYGNLQEATTAKAAFEREHNVIAYVAGGTNK